MSEDEKCNSSSSTNDFPMCVIFCNKLRRNSITCFETDTSSWCLDQRLNYPFLTKRCHDVLVRLVGRDFRKVLWTKWKYMPNTDIKIMCINVMIYDCLSDASITVVWIEIISTWVKSAANLLCYSDNCSMKSLFLSRCLLNNTDFVTPLIWSFTSSVVFIIGRGEGFEKRCHAWFFLIMSLTVGEMGALRVSGYYVSIWIYFCVRQHLVRWCIYSK